MGARGNCVGAGCNCVVSGRLLVMDDTLAMLSALNFNQKALTITEIYAFEYLFCKSTLESFH